MNVLPTNTKSFGHFVSGIMLSVGASSADADKYFVANYYDAPLFNTHVLIDICFYLARPCPGKACPHAQANPFTCRTLTA